MLSYPGLYPTRFRALLEIWGNSGNYCWNESGELVRSYVDDRSTTEMDYSDLDQRQVRIDNEHRSHQDLYDRWCNEIKIERMERELRAANIDLYASTEMMAGAHQTEQIMSSLGEFSSGNLFTIPENATPEFRQAAMDFIDDLCPMLYYAAQAKKDGGLWGSLQAQKREIYGPQAFDEHEAATHALIDTILKEIKDKENGR